MSNKRLIDGMSDTISKQALLNRINITATRHRNDGEHVSASILTLLHDEIKSGMYDIPSNQGEVAKIKAELMAKFIRKEKETKEAHESTIKQLTGEAARLREALKYIKEHRGSRIDDEIVAEIDEALSSYTEDTGQSERIKLLLEMYGLYKGTPLEDSHEDYKRGVRDTLEALGITIPGITDGGEQDA